MLNTKQRKCLELMAAGEMTQKQIAEQVHVSEKTICEWKKNEDFVAEYHRIVKAGISSLAAKAFKTQQALLSSRSEMVKYLVSKDILDRAGFAPEENINLTRGMPVQIVDNIPDSPPPKAE